MPAIVLGELYTGINRVTNRTKHLKRLADFLTLCTIISIDEATAKIYGELIAALYKKKSQYQPTTFGLLHYLFSTKLQ